MGWQGNACANGVIGVKSKPNTQSKLRRVHRQAMTNKFLRTSVNANYDRELL